MFNWWPFGRKSVQTVSRPTLHVEVDPGGNVQVSAAFPPVDCEDAEYQAAEKMATAAFLLTTGHLTGVIQQSISMAGHQQNCERVAALTLEFLCRSLQELAFRNGQQVGQQDGDQDSGIRVPGPREVF